MAKGSHLNTIYLMGERSLNGHPESLCEAFLNMKSILKAIVIMKDMPGALSGGSMEQWNPVSEFSKARWPYIKVDDEWTDKSWCQNRRGEFLERKFLNYDHLPCFVILFSF